MNKTILAAAGASLALAAAACAPTPPASSSAAASTAAVTEVDVRAEMQQHINPAMLSIWEVTNNAMDDAGELDPGLIDDAKWRQIANAAQQLAASGTRMAEGATLVAASADNTSVAEGEVSMADVQRYLDREPQLFKQMGAAFATYSGRLAQAAQARDATTTGTLVSGMDGVCESCHARFWYPEQ